MLRRIFFIVKKELIQSLRDKRAAAMLLVAPVFQLLIFGYVATTDLKRSATVICDYDKTQTSREFIDKFTASGYFEDKYYVESLDDIESYIESGDAMVAIMIPGDFEESLKRGEEVTVGFILDATNSNRATILNGYISFITRDYSNRVAAEFIQGGASRLAFPLDVQPRVWFNPDLKSVNFMVPGVMAMLTLIVLLNISSLSIVRERELGTAEQLVVTPIRSIELVIGKIFPAAFAGYLVTTLVLVAGLVWFNINFEGSVVLLYFFAGIFMYCAISLGLLISTFSQTGDQAMWANQFFVMPNVLLSGFIFPIANMPLFIQYTTYVLPMRYFLIIIRGIFLRGAGFNQLWPQALILFLWGTVVIVVAAIRLRKHMV
jgi:ABC-2 type transport system permease protein